jgi:hypothetical protein
MRDPGSERCRIDPQAIRESLARQRRRERTALCTILPFSGAALPIRISSGARGADFYSFILK